MTESRTGHSGFPQNQESTGTVTTRHASNAACAVRTPEGLNGHNPARCIVIIMRHKRTRPCMTAARRLRARESSKCTPTCARQMPLPGEPRVGAHTHAPHVSHRRQQQRDVTPQHSRRRDKQVHDTARVVAANLRRIVFRESRMTSQLQLWRVTSRTHSAQAQFVTASANVLGSVRDM
jgi:hypothetical protein